MTKERYVVEILPPKRTSSESSPQPSHYIRYSPHRPMFIRPQIATEVFSAIPQQEIKQQPEMTLDDVIKGIKTCQIRWGEVLKHPALVKEILTKSREEISDKIERETGHPLPISGLKFTDFKYNFDFLQGGQLQGLTRYIKKQTGEEEVITYLLRIANVEPFVEDIVKIKRCKRNINWERFYGTPLKNIFHIVSQTPHGQKPLGLVTKQDFTKPQEILDGDNFESLYHHAYDKKHEVPIKYLRNKAGITLSGEDIETGLQMGIEMPWSQLEGDNAVNEFLNTVARKDIKRPIFLWRKRDFEKRLTNGRTLTGLKNYLQKNKKGKTIIQYLQEVARIPVTIDDINWAMDLKIPFWHKVPPETKKELFETAARERGIPPNMFTRRHMENRFDFLGGRSLLSLYNYTRTINLKMYPDNPLSTIPSLIIDNDVTITVEDIAFTMARQKVMWDAIPNKTIKALLEKMAEEAEEGGKPLLDLGKDDFLTPRDCLGGRSASSLYTRSIESPHRQGRDFLAFLFDTVGIVVTFQDVVTCYTENRHIKWERVSTTVLAEILTAAATELGISVPLLSSHVLQAHKFAFLGGRTLEKLYFAEIYAKKNSDLSAIRSLKERAGFTHASTTRRRSREVAMINSFKHLKPDYQLDASIQSFLEQKPPEVSLTIYVFEQLNDWIASTADTFERQDADLFAEEIINQVLVITADILSTTPEITYEEFIKQTHVALEAYCALFYKYLREKSLSIPLGKTDLKLEETQFAGPMISEGLIFSQDVHAALSTLSPLQQRVLEGIADKWTFDEIRDQMNTFKESYGLVEDVTSETLEEKLKEALLILQSKISPSDADHPVST